MARTIYGFELYNSPTNGVNFDGGKNIGNNDEVFTYGDAVKVASGFLTVAGTNDRIYGVVQKTATMTADNETVAKVKPKVLVPDQNYVFLCGADADVTNDHVGSYASMTGATGAQQLSHTTINTSPTGLNLEIVGTDPLSEGGTGSGSGLRQVLVRFVTVNNTKN